MHLFIILVLNSPLVDKKNTRVFLTKFVRLRVTKTFNQFILDVANWLALISSIFNPLSFLFDYFYSFFHFWSKITVEIKN